MHHTVEKLNNLIMIFNVCFNEVSLAYVSLQNHWYAVASSNSISCSRILSKIERSLKMVTITIFFSEKKRI